MNVIVQYGMRWGALLFLPVLMLCSCGTKENKTAVSKGIVITDDMNVRIAFDSVPHKVISLAPNLTELIYAAGGGKYLAGNTLYCNYPPEARKVYKVGDLITLDYERILAVKPDLIFITVEGNSLDSYNKLKSLGLKVFVSNPRDFTGIKKTFSNMGKIFKTEDTTSAKIRNWDERYKKVTDEAALRPHPLSMFIVALNPIMLAGKNTFINELLTSAGLVNIASDSKLNYPVFSREEILRRNPDLIISTDDPSVIYKKMLESYPEWNTLKAVKNKHVITCDPDLYLRPGPRFMDAVEDLFAKRKEFLVN